METTVSAPTPAQIADRIRDCRAELKALSRLYRLAVAVRAADAARAKRLADPDEPKGCHNAPK